MAKTGKVREIRNRMLEIFGENCWMGYTLDRKNPFTFHHIFEQRKGGKDLIDNGAILTSHAHQDLNQLDMHHKVLYRELNLLFTALNETKTPPTVEYYKEVNEILKRADKVIELSPYCNLEPDYGLVDEILKEKKKVEEENNDGYIKIGGVYMPVSYDTREINYLKEEPKDIVEISIEYKEKVKKKNRNHKNYSFK